MIKALSPYPDRLKAHLATYKRTVLGIHEDGTWSRTGKSYSHILPAAQQDLNFISFSRDLTVKYLAERPHIQRHRDFHHLNSSQAMCINLMCPLLFSTEACAAVSEHLQLPSRIDPDTASFEWIPEPSEGTNFDFFARTVGGESVYFEFKLSESEFGKATADTRHLDKLKDIYAPRLRALVHESHLQPEHFFRRYQLFRNLSYLADLRATLVLVMPRGHVKLASQAKAFVAGLNDETKARVRIAYMEDLSSAMLDATPLNSSSLRNHLQEFQMKYSIA